MYKKKKEQQRQAKLFTPLTPSNMIHLVLKIQSSSSRYIWESYSTTLKLP